MLISLQLLQLNLGVSGATDFLNKVYNLVSKKNSQFLVEENLLYTPLRDNTTCEIAS